MANVKLNVNLKEFENKDGQARFTVPERPSVRQQMAYTDAMFRGGDGPLAWWFGARELIQDWDCKLVPKLENLDLDKVDDPKITDLLIWAGLQVKLHMAALDSVPKN
jgi:hypothetical protein